MSKKIALENLLNNYVDNYGRVTIIPAAKTDPANNVYDSENNHLWTGEANMLIALNGLLDNRLIFKLKSNLATSLFSTVVAPGLYARQPFPYLNTKHYSSVSIDEYNGINFSQISLYMAGTEGAKAITDYGRLTCWIYKEQEPFVNPIKVAKSSDWSLACKTLVRVIKHGLKSGDIDGSNSMDQVIYGSPLLERLSRMRLPKDKYFMKLTALESTTMLEKLHYYLTALHTVKKEKSLTSGKIMLFFKLESQRLLGFKNIVYKLVRGYVHKKLKQQYGEQYMEELFKLYFTKDDQHPFHELVKGLTLEVTNE